MLTDLSRSPQTVKDKNSSHGQDFNYKVYVDDRFHYLDEDERYLDGIYADCQAAYARCCEIVEQCLASLYAEGMTAQILLEQYQIFGDDPWISCPENDCFFSAINYAAQKCPEICSADEK